VSPLDARLLVCGGSAASQGPALHISPNVDRAQALKVIATEAQAIMRASVGPRPILAVLFQGAPELGALSGLTQAGFTRFESDPSLALTLDPRWVDFDDLLASLTSKYRVKAKRADALSSELEQVALDAQGARLWREALHATYEQVTERATFCVRATELDALPELLEAQPERYSLSAYLAQDELIGFRLSVHEGDTLYAQLVGINYEKNRTFGLYPRMLNDYIREGLERGCRVVDLGRTAGEIKSTLGALPSATELYLTHAHPLMSWALPYIAQRVTPATHKQHQPFKR
jgi:predicted N-acyltransferase